MKQAGNYTAPDSPYAHRAIVPNLSIVRKSVCGFARRTML